MIERYVFVKLKPEHATAKGRAEVVEKSRKLSAVPGVRALTVGQPADAGATAAWDLSLALRFDSLADVEAYLEHAGHEAYWEAFLEPRVQVIKFWNFEV
jgi:Stress responsive A/B Barrel Domain